MNRFPLALVLTAALCGVGQARPKPAPPPPPQAEAVFDYRDTDAFDGALEAALVTRTPRVVIRTGTAELDWEGRLVEWVAAWKAGYRKKNEPGFLVRCLFVFGGGGGDMAAPAAIQLPPDTAKEARVLIEGCLDRAERLAREGAAGTARWWADRKKKEKRIALLRPYALKLAKEGGSYQVELTLRSADK
jgi:hypothetical protein